VKIHNAQKKMKIHKREGFTFLKTTIKYSIISGFVDWKNMHIYVKFKKRKRWGFKLGVNT